jgi:Domain of unknown function (DUF4335)
LGRIIKKYPFTNFPIRGVTTSKLNYPFIQIETIMESANLTTRTYTAQTCSLSVTTKPRSLPHLPRFDRPKSGDFTLQIDRAEDPGAEPIHLNGQLEQLDKLQQSVSKYVAQLVAQFPMGTADSAENRHPELEDLAPEPIPEAAVASHLYPTSGIAKNLPGLRNKAPQLAVKNIPVEESKASYAFSAASISKLLGRSNPISGSLTALESNVASKSVMGGVNDRSDTLPRLTVGDLPLEHKLYLSDNNSGQVLTLTQSQLFDLGTTLDEYANEVVTTSSFARQNLGAVTTPKIETSKIETPKIEALKIEEPEIEVLKIETPKIEVLKIEEPEIEVLKIETPKIEVLKIEEPEIEAPKIEEPEIKRSTKFSSTTTPSGLSGLPNLPHLPAKSSSRSYDYGDESRPAFMSAIPWVAAAALVVGVPFLLFGSNPDLLKESMAKVKMPSDPRELFNNKTVAGSNKPEQPATKPTGDGVANAATAGLPKPWESKPVEPPASIANAALPGTPIPQPPGAAEIGIAPLPPSIMNITEQQASVQTLPKTTTPETSGLPGAPGAAIANAPLQKINPIPSDIAPNPLSSGIPTGIPPLASQKQVPPPASKPSTQTQIDNPLMRLDEQPKINKPNTAVKTKSKTNNPFASTASAPKPNQVKKVASRNPAKIGVSQQPFNLPPAFEAISNEPPLAPPPFPTAKSEKPTPVKKQKKVAVKSKPKQAVVSKKVAKVTPLKNRQPKQPPIIVPVQAPDPSTVPSEFTPPAGMPEIKMPETNIPEVPPVVPQPQLQSNNGGSNPFENPSLKEAKRYFQDKWRADSSQTSTLQYVVQVNAKGVVQSVNPQSEAATTYLKKSGMVKTGQTLIPPTTTGESEQKIRVLLDPDGNVEALTEPN